LAAGIETLPTAALVGPELDLRLLGDHRERLLRTRVALNNTLQWNLHDLWPELTLPGGALFSKKWTTKIARRRHAGLGRGTYRLVQPAARVDGGPSCILRAGSAPRGAAACMELGSSTAAFPRMQERHRLRSRAGGRLHLAAAGTS